MIAVVSVDEMRRSDAYTIENCVPSLELMYRAALGVFRAGKWFGRIAIVAGSGNNGGDGFALSCILRDNGISSTVYTVSEKLSADSSHYCRLAAQKNVPVFPYTPGCLEGYDIIVDCLLGTGFGGKIRDSYCRVIRDINTQNAFILSVDINSGMNGDTGESDCCVRSDLTVAIGFVKKGQVVPKAGNQMDKLVCADIGIVFQGEQEFLKAVPPWLDPVLINVK